MKDSVSAASGQFHNLGSFPTTSSQASWMKCRDMILNPGQNSRGGLDIISSVEQSNCKPIHLCYSYRVVGVLRSRNLETFWKKRNHEFSVGMQNQMKRHKLHPRNYLGRSGGITYSVWMTPVHLLGCCLATGNGMGQSPWQPWRARNNSELCNMQHQHIDKKLGNLWRRLM